MNITNLKYKGKIRCQSILCPSYNQFSARNCMAWSPIEKCGFRDLETVKVRDVLPILERKMGPEGKKLTEVFKEEEKVRKMSYYNLPEETDMVNSPPHYLFMEGIEVKDVIKRAVHLNFPVDGVGAGWYWQVLKYLLRCGRKKKKLEDLKKARFYLDELIKEVEDA